VARSSTTWQKGQSGNPNGRPPREHTLSEHLRAVLAEEVAGPNGETIPRALLLARTLVACALQGDVRAAGLILDRLEGKPRLSLEIEGDAPTIRVIRTPLRIPDHLLPKGAADAEPE